MDPESQRLRITAYSVSADASLWIDANNRPDSHQIILPGTNNLALSIRPYWDDERHALKPDNSVLCVFQSAVSHCGLILKCHGKYYGRVGCFKMDQSLDPSLFQRTEELCDKSLHNGPEAAVASKSGLIKRRTFELR
jgi:hypothetical protein